MKDPVLTAGATLFLLLAATGPLPAQQKEPRSSSSPFRISVSVSPFTEIVLHSGIEFRDGNTTATHVREVQQIFVKHGSNEVYARIGTAQKYRRGFGDHSLAKGLDRARLAAAMKLPFNPELGLFAVYGDIRCQPAPDFSEYPRIDPHKRWTSLSLEQMEPLLRAYGAYAAREILKTGARVRIWDLGNEVEFGFAGVAPHPMPNACDDSEGAANWYQAPDAIDAEIGRKSVLDLLRMPEPERIAWLQHHIWPRQARMFAALATGIRGVDPHARFSTHVSGVAAVLPKIGVAFYSAMRAGGFLPDELGFSFYPSSSDKPADRLEAFRQTAQAVMRELHRPVFVAEFGYPASPMKEGAFAAWNHAIPGYPITPAGQASLYRDLIAWLKQAGGSGIRPWAPDAPVPGWEPMALFSANGKNAVTRPALEAIQKAAGGR